MTRESILGDLRALLEAYHRGDAAGFEAMVDALELDEARAMLCAAIGALAGGYDTA